MTDFALADSDGDDITITSSSTPPISLTDSDPATIVINSVSDGAPGIGVPTGGSSGQVLAKNSSADYDTAWTTNAAAAVSSVNSQTGAVVLTQDNVADGTTYKQYSATDKTKLAGIATGATANSSDATLLDRTNHTGTQSADTLTDGTTNKAFLATERTKLAGIATGATANSSDAVLEARANHTGTQLASTISDFSTAADARVAAGITGKEDVSNKSTTTTLGASNTLYPTQNAVKSYVDAAIIAAGGYTDEQAQDAVGNILTDSTDIDFTYNDAANTITAVATGTTGTTGLVRASSPSLITPTLGGATVTDATDIVLGTTTGTKIGTATTQKLGFFAATPVVQQAATTDLGTVLSALGLRVAGTSYPVTTGGAAQLTGPFRMGQSTQTTAVTLSTGSSPNEQLVNATTGAVTITLPATTAAGYEWVIKKIDSSANAVTVAGTIDGATNYVLSNQYDWVHVISTGTSGTFYIRGSNKVPAGNIVASTAAAVGVGTIELGHATDTTLSRSAAGVLAVEGNTVITSASSSNLLPSGSTVQVVSTQTGAVATGTTTIPPDNTIPQNTEGDQYMSVAITPKSTTNHLFIEVKAQVSHSTAIVDIIGALFQDTTANAVAAGWVTQAGTTYKNILTIGFDMAAGTTSATTFKFRAGGGAAGTVTLNGSGGGGLLGGVLYSYIKVTEYKP